MLGVYTRIFIEMSKKCDEIDDVVDIQRIRGFAIALYKSTIIDIRDEDKGDLGG